MSEHTNNEQESFYNLAETDMQSDIDSLLFDIDRLHSQFTANVIQEIQSDLNKVDLHKVSVELSRISQRFLELTNRLIKYLNFYREHQTAIQREKSSGELGMSMVYIVQMMEAELGWLQGLMNGISAAQTNPSSNTSGVQNIVNNVKNWINNTLKPLFSKIPPQVWQFVKRMVTPKEWSITGIIGNNFLGFVSGELCITFGP